MDDERYIIGHPAYDEDPILCPNCDGLGYTESTFDDEDTGAVITEQDPCTACGGSGIEPDAERDWDVDPY